MSTTMSVSEARAALPEILDRVLAGEEVTLTRHGKSVAVVVSPDSLRVRRADEALASAERLRVALDRARATPLRSTPTLSRQRADDLVADVQAARSRRQAVGVIDAFDADVLIYAAVADHGLGRRVRALFPASPVQDSGVVAGIGSVLLVPELLTKPLRESAVDELDELVALLARLELRPTDEATARLATSLGASYGLRAADAVHLATAVGAGADRFLTNNRSDFPSSIGEVDVTYPEDLPDPPSP